MTALPRQDQLFDVPPSDAADDTTDRPTALEGTTPARSPFRQKSKAELEREGVKAVYLRRIGRPYAAVAQDHAAWTELKKLATSIEEIERFWDFSLSQPPDAWLHAATIWQLRRKWNDLATVLAKTATEERRPSCEVCSTEAWFCFSRVWLCSPCMEQAQAVANAVAFPLPLPTTPTDPRVREHEQARDLAVSLWARERQAAATKERR